MASKIVMYIDEMIERIRRTSTLSSRARDSRLQEIYKDVCIHCKIERVGVPPEIRREIKKVSPDIELESPSLPPVPYNSYSILPWVKKRQKEENEEYIDFCLHLDKIDDPKVLLDRYVKMLEDAIKAKEKPNERLLLAVSKRFREKDKKIGWEYGYFINLKQIDYQRGIKNIIQQLKDRLAYIEFMKKHGSDLYYANGDIKKNTKNEYLIQNEIKRLKLSGQLRSEGEFCKWLERIQKEMGTSPKVSVKKDTTISYAKHKSNVINDYVKKDHGI